MVPAMSFRPGGRPRLSGLTALVVLSALLDVVCPHGAAAAQRASAEAAEPVESAEAAESAGADAPHVRATRIDQASFWYDTTEPQAAGDGTLWAAPGAVQQLEAALHDVLRRHADTFSQPPPLDIVIRAPERTAVGGSLAWSRLLGSYSCARLVDGVVVIEVAPSTFVGRDALEPAELRSLLAHELVHASQLARGDHRGDTVEIARREVEALTWELAHLEPEVRPWYRDDLLFNLEMYRALLGGR